MVERLVGSKTIQRLKTRTLPAGLRDVEEWTGVTLTFRRSTGTGWEDKLTTPAISIRLNDGRGVEALGGVETTTRGMVKIWADAEVLHGDRFLWGGHWCVVDLVQPTRLGAYTTVEFTLMEN